MRLQRVGRKNNPAYRVVVVDRRTSPKSKKVVDTIGAYNPKLGTITIDTEKAKNWIKNGVQPSDTVYNMLVGKQVIEGRKRNALPKKSPIIDEAKLKAEAEAKAAAEREAAEKAAAEKAAAEAPAEEPAAAPAEETPAA